MTRLSEGSPIRRRDAAAANVHAGPIGDVGRRLMTHQLAAFRLGNSEGVGHRRRSGQRKNEDDGNRNLHGPIIPRRS